ncbi:MAG TPA: hypothetical protein VIZ18_01545 [Ktedonobacteraceae bacterium]
MDTSAAQQPTTGQHKQDIAASRKKGLDLARALDYEKATLMRADEERRFSHALTNFLEQACVKGSHLSISDKQLFRSFRVFWLHAPEQFDHPALLGQFRVELAQRGFPSDSAGKHPRWLGLALRMPAKQRARKKERA